MSKFINIEDYDASIHREILDAITRDDYGIIEIVEDRAIAEMKSYLSGRFDVNAIFSAEENDRNELILMMAMDITIYHLFCIHNPRNLSEMRKDRYNRAMEWLKQVRDKDLPIDGAPLLDNVQLKDNNRLLFASNTKRTQHL